MQGPDHVPRVELGVAGDEAAAAHHAVAHLIQTIQDLLAMFRKRIHHPNETIIYPLKVFIIWISTIQTRSSSLKFDS